MYPARSILAPGFWMTELQALAISSRFASSGYWFSTKKLEERWQWLKSCGCSFAVVMRENIKPQKHRNQVSSETEMLFDWNNPCSSSSLGHLVMNRTHKHTHTRALTSALASNTAQRQRAPCGLITVSAPSTYCTRLMEKSIGHSRWDCWG